MNIIFTITGGIGKCIAGTAVAEAIKKQYPDSKLIVISPHPNIFKNNPFVDKVEQIHGFLNAAYELYCKGKEFKVFTVDPFHHNDFITNTGHLIPTWCKANSIKYNGELPQIFLSEAEQDYYGNYYNFDNLAKPIMAIQVNGGNPDPRIQPGYNWARDLPLEIVKNIIEEYRDHYTIVNIKRPDQQGYNDTIECVDDPRGVAYLLQHSEKRMFIDSFAQHMAAALNLPSTVCWITTSPTVFGYDIHDDVFANPLKKDFVTTESTYSQFELNESIIDFPWDNGNDVFDINKIFQSINKD